MTRNFNWIGIWSMRWRCSKGHSYHFRFGIIFLKKYHATATRFEPKKSILHKIKNKIVSPKSITKIQRLRAGYKHVLFLPDYRYMLVPNQSSNHGRNLRELCKWTTIVNSICTGICCSHVITFVFYCLRRAGRVIVDMHQE